MKNHKHQVIKIAVLSESTSQFLVQSLKSAFSKEDISVEIFESDFDQIEIQVLDDSSELYIFNPDYVVVMPSYSKFLARYAESELKQRDVHLMRVVSHWDKILTKINMNLPAAAVLVANYPEVDNFLTTTVSYKSIESLTQQLRSLNLELVRLLSARSYVTLLDLVSIQIKLSSKIFFDHRIRYLTKSEYSFAAYDEISERITKRIRTLSGKFVKLICVDLDGTLWGGVVGDDGWENLELGEFGLGTAYSEMQRYLLELKKIGVLIAICSKNELEVVLEAFNSNPAMLLKVDDIAVFMVNWESKDKNIREISQITEIGLDSIVFLDDNPFERRLVQEVLPEVIVPELPDDPSEYLNFLYNLDLFDMPVSNSTDGVRTHQIQAKLKLQDMAESFETVEDFLSSICMTARVEKISSRTIGRFSQLSLRSNQFNLRTVRYNETSLQIYSDDPSYYPFSVTLRDNIADHGLIAGVVLKEIENLLFIENFFMSCRVLRRGVEDLVFNEILQYAVSRNIKVISGEYAPTQKNALVINLLKDWGFIQQLDEFWHLEVAKGIPRNHFIRKEVEL